MNTLQIRMNTMEIQNEYNANIVTTTKTITTTLHYLISVDNNIYI
jgi:hypothetical protein